MTNLDHPILNETVHRILATADADGKPQTSVIFVKRDDDDILFQHHQGAQRGIRVSGASRHTILAARV